MSQDSTEFNLPGREPLLFVVSGTTAAGKDTVIHGLRERDIPFRFVVTATSRPPRPGEVHGEDYFFYSVEEFQSMIEHDELFEYAEVYGQYKGIPKRQVKEAFASGMDVIMRLDVQGAATIRRLFPEAVLIFLTPKNEEELIQRLKERKTEDGEMLNRRVAAARLEFERLGEYDYVVINQDGRLEDALDDIAAIIRAEHLKVKQRKVNL
jgi:guanylate kinase